MPFYRRIDGSKDEGRRTIEGILRLKEALDKEIPRKTLDQTLLVASWNIREFGGEKYDGREDEPLFYISEIMSHFDLIAVQEVRDNLDALDQLMNILGGWWKYLVSDVTQGRQGNNERLAFIYDTRKLAFGGLAGEITPPMEKAEKVLVAKFVFARSPYLVGFRAGWFKFTICTSHLYYGDSKPDDLQRRRESEELVKLLKQRMKDKDRWANNAILLGDFNIFSTDDATFQALETGNFRLPRGLRGKYTNAKLDKPFDQMAFLSPDVEKQVELANAGVFPFYNYVYRDSDINVYLKGEEKKQYSEWRTYKMSDHLPIWVELGIDFSKNYLRNKIKNG
jgi:endonuclease/exonuclease/phosphatase family metal-dependent hydrolase